MKVDTDAARQAWQHLKDQPVDIAAGLGNMAGIDKQDVVGSQRFKCRQGNILSWLTQQGYALVVFRRNEG